MIALLNESSPKWRVMPGYAVVSRLYNAFVRRYAALLLNPSSDIRPSFMQFLLVLPFAPQCIEDRLCEGRRLALGKTTRRAAMNPFFHISQHLLSAGFPCFPRYAVCSLIYDLHFRHCFRQLGSKERRDANEEESDAARDQEMEDGPGDEDRGSGTGGDQDVYMDASDGEDELMTRKQGALGVGSPHPDLPDDLHGRRNDKEWKIQEVLIRDLWNSRTKHPGKSHSFTEDEKQKWGEILHQYIQEILPLLSWESPASCPLLFHTWPQAAALLPPCTP